MAGDVPEDPSLSFVEAAQGGMPQDWRDDSPAARFVMSAFSEIYLARLWSWKLPFTISPQDIDGGRHIGARVGGFGPLYSGALILSLASLLVTLIAIGPVRPLLAAIAVYGLLVLSVVLNPLSHDARYMVQAPLIPLTAAGIALGAGVLTKTTWRRYLHLAAVLLAVATTLVMVQNGAWMLARHVERAREFEAYIESNA
jgi:hypothetical protein